MSSNLETLDRKKAQNTARTVISSGSKEAKEGKETSSNTTKDTKKEIVKKEDGEESASFQTKAIPDTLDTRFAIHALQKSSDGISSGTTSHDSNPGSDGPLLLTLLMGNNNLNSAAQAQAQAGPQPDTLDTRFAVHEVMGYSHTIPDTIDSRRAVIEFASPQHNGSAPVLKMRGVAQRPILDDKQVQSWKDNGYLVIPNMLAQESVAELFQCVHECAEAIATGGPSVKKQVFSGWVEGCVNPNGRVIAALTEHAFQPGATPLQHIQRLGCGVHRVLRPFRRAIMSAQHVDIAKSLGYNDPRVVQSLVIVKAAHVGAEVVPHQDACTSFTDPPSCATFWYALEGAKSENGCLQVVPGSHRVTPITGRCRKQKNGMPEFEDWEPAFADIQGVSVDAPEPMRTEKGDFVYKELEVEAGTLVLMHGNLLHTSAANRSGKSRVAFNFGVVEGELEWKDDNYLQPYENEFEFEKLHAC